MTDYNAYLKAKGLMQKDLVDVIHQHYPQFKKYHMSVACYPESTALQLVPEAETLIAERFGYAPGLSIYRKKKNHGNKNKPCRLYLRLDNQLRSRLQSVYEKMCFASMQDLLETAVSEFVEKYERAS